MVVAYFANWQDISAQINHLCNRSADGTFSHLGDTGETADKRYSDAAINEARRKAAYKIFNAIGSNLSHPYWGQLKTDVTVAYGAVIPPHYGEIGIPIISTSGGAYETGLEADPDEIESYRSNRSGTFGNFYGTDDDDINHNQSTNDSIPSPLSRRYSTSNGVFKFTGTAGKIPMIQVPDTEADAETMADEKIPFDLAALNVKLALPMLIKEGDNLFRVAAWLGQEGEKELINVKMGGIHTMPIDPNKVIQMAQRMT